MGQHVFFSLFLNTYKYAICAVVYSVMYTTGKEIAQIQFHARVHVFGN